MEGWDPTTKSTLTQIPLLSVKAGPRDGGAWTQRLKEEYKALIAYTSMNKGKDNDWFRISAANPEGTRWTGKCWYIHNLLKYEFDLQFDIPVTYPATAPEIELPQLDGKTQKVLLVPVDYRLCFLMNMEIKDEMHHTARSGYPKLDAQMTVEWYLTDVQRRKNMPDSAFQAALGKKLVPFVRHSPLSTGLGGSAWFGIAHALCLGLAPWLAAEIPILVDSGMIKHKDDAASSNETS